MSLPAIAETNNFNLNDTHTSRFSVARQLFSIKIGFIVKYLRNVSWVPLNDIRCYLENIRIVKCEFISRARFRNLINVAQTAHISVVVFLF